MKNAPVFGLGVVPVYCSPWSSSFSDMRKNKVIKHSYLLEFFVVRYGHIATHKDNERASGFEPRADA